MILTEQKIVELVAESLEKYLLKEEDGMMPYISDILNRFGVKFDYGTDPEHDDDFITIQFENSAQKRDVVRFLAQMDYFQNDAVLGQNTVSFSKMKNLNENTSKTEIIDFVKKDKDFEKRVKQIASDVVTELFRVLWQHNAIFKNLSR